jgi:hypothetical protein
MFEMLSKDNIIVTRPGEDRIVLHGARDIRNLQEIDPKVFADLYGWPLVKMTKYSSLQEVITAAKKLDPSLEEGFVVCDAKFNRVKVKSPQYVALSLMNVYDSKSLNYNHMTKIVRTHEGSEFLSYFPSYEPLYRVVSETYKILTTSLETMLVKVKKQFKDFANAEHEEVRILVTSQLEFRHPDAVDTYVDIILKLLRTQQQTLLDVLEKWGIDDLVVLMHQLHGPQQKAVLTKYKATLPKKTKGGVIQQSVYTEDDGEDSKANTEIESDFDRYEKPSIQRAKQKLQQQQQKRGEITSSSSTQPRKGIQNRGDDDGGNGRKLSKREQRKLDEEFENALQYAKKLDEEGARPNYHPPNSKKALRQEEARQKQNKGGGKRGKKQ